MPELVSWSRNLELLLVVKLVSALLKMPKNKMSFVMLLNFDEFWTV